MISRKRLAFTFVPIETQGHDLLKYTNLLANTVEQIIDFLKKN